ncbi:MAG TPA: iron-sulfur cluster assembly accessory protein, partial [Armatimonadota bacterium]|nr:iron-sulfur cluster assembly accessory protein [Armatimonadota bacterium]
MDTLTLAPPANLVQMTPAAITKVRENLEKLGNPDNLYLRLGVKGGGCSGFSYVLEFDGDT